MPSKLESRFFLQTQRACKLQERRASVSFAAFLATQQLVSNYMLSGYVKNRDAVSEVWT